MIARLNALARALASLVLAGLLVGAPVRAQIPAPAPAPEYLVGPGDVLKISVYRAPDLETVTRVAGDGTIVFGPLGSVPVARLSPAGIGRLLTARLKQGGIFLDPAVNVSVAEYHSNTVSVLGAVSRPGEYPIDRTGLSITEVLARAGANFERGGAIISIVPAPGTSGTARTLHVSDLLRDGADRPVQRGESIFVQAPAIVYIRGEVQRPGGYPLEPGMTVDQAVSLAGGLTARGSGGRIKVTRQGSQGGAGASTRIRLTDPVQGNDTLVVGAKLF